MTDEPNNINIYLNNDRALIFSNDIKVNLINNFDGIEVKEREISVRV